jgi:hypothetical protein
MSVRFDISNLLVTHFELEEQMQELLRLRRALCLLNAKRDRPQRSRPGLGRVSRAKMGTPNTNLQEVDPAKPTIRSIRATRSPGLPTRSFGRTR